MKKIISLLLTFALVIAALTPAKIFADDVGDTVCYIGETAYTDLKTAIDDVNSGVKTGSIKLVADAVLSSPTVLEANIVITTDNNDHTVYCCNTSSNSAEKYGRIFQTSGSYTLTIGGTGRITFQGSSEDGAEENAGVFIAGYSKSATINISNVSIIGFTNTLNGTTSKLGGAIYNCGKLNLTDCSFTDNTSKNSSGTGNDIHLEANGSISLDGTCDIEDLYLTSGKTVTLSSGFSINSEVGLSLADEAVIGLTVATGDGTGNAQGLFLNSSSADYTIGKDGKIKAREVAYILGAASTKYSTLEAAVSAAGAGKTIVLIDDCYVNKRITRSGNLTITDDGYPHTIYLYNEDGTSGGGYGRGFQVNKGTVSISGTEAGYISFVGHDKTGTIDNAGPALCCYAGTLNLTNVTISEIYNSKNGGGLTVSKGATVNLSNTTITNCSASRGAGIYCEGGTVNIKDGTSIINNYSKGTSDPILGGVGAVEKDDTQPLITLSGKDIYITGNLKNCVYQEGGRTPISGTPSNISISDPAQLKLKGSVKGKVGIDFSAAEVKNGVFGTTGNAYYSKNAFFADGDTGLKPYVDGSNNLYWNTYSYSAYFGEPSFLTSYGYSYPAFSITLDSEGADSLSIAVDNGYFFVDMEKTELSLDFFRGVKADDSYTFVNTVDGCEYRGITLTKNAGFTKTEIETLVRSITFYSEADNQVQTVFVGTNMLSGDGETEFYFNGGIYTVSKENFSWSQAELKAADNKSYLININSRLENAMVSGISSGNYWTGALSEAGVWYWRQTDKAFKIADGFKSWAESESFTGNRAYITADGSWKTADSNETFGYIAEEEDTSLCSNRQVISPKVADPVLREMNLCFSEDICAVYYFQFSDDFAANTNNYIKVEVGEAENKLTYTATVFEMLECKNANGYYGISVPFAAKRLNDKVSIYAVSESGEILRQFGRATSYNPCYYAKVLLETYDNQGSNVYAENVTAAEAKALKAMLNYGAAAQELFEYNKENPANAGYEDASAVTDTGEMDTAYYSATGDVTFTKASLEAADTPVMRFYYSSSNPVTSVTVGGEAVDILQNTDGYYVDIPVYAMELGKIITVEINGTSSLSVNAYYVIKLILEQSTNEMQIQTADRLYKFAEATAEYEGVSYLEAGALEAVLNTAYAYLVKEDNTQYDQSTFTARYFSGYKLNRRQIGISPEELSDDYYAYLDCSSFVYSVYSNVFGQTNFENAVGLNAANFSTSDMTGLSNSNVVASWSGNRLADNPNEVFDDLMNIVQPGDLIVKYAVAGTNGASSSHGHVVMWVGTGYIHCTGKSYTYSESKGTDATESNGAVHFVAADDFNANWLDTCKYLTVIRPLNSLGKDDLSTYGVARAELGAMGISKTAVDITTDTRLTNGQAVSIGDEITYTIELDNSRFMIGNSNADRVVSVIQNLPDGVELVSASSDCGTVIAMGKLVLWGDVAVPQGEKILLSYTVRVTGSETDSIGRAVISDKDTTITCRTGSDEPEAITIKGKDICVEGSGSTNTLLSKAEQYITAGTTGELTGLGFINSFYSEVMGRSFSLSSDDDTLFSSIFVNGSSYMIMNSEAGILSSGLGKYIVGNVIGGRYVYDYKYNSMFAGDNRIRNVSIDNLEVGDVIAIKHILSESLGYYYYIYLGNNQMLLVKSTGTSVSSIAADTALEGLISKGAFVAFRILDRQ